MSSRKSSKISNKENENKIEQDKVVRSSVSLVSRPLDGGSERVSNKLTCGDIEYETMMAPPFEENATTMLSRVGNSSSNCDTMQFLGPTNNKQQQQQQQTDMRNGCDNDLDGNNTKNKSSNSSLRLVDLVDKKSSSTLNTKTNYKKSKTEVKQQVRRESKEQVESQVPLSLCLTTATSSDGNGNQDELSSNHHYPISNERRDQEEEDIINKKEGQHFEEKSSLLLLNDNRREVRGRRRRFSNSLISPSSSIGTESSPSSQNSPHTQRQHQVSTSVRRKLDDEHKQVSNDNSEEKIGGQDWLLLSSRSGKNKEEEIDELSPLQKVDNKLKLFESRERSSSITSDYFSSSNHESPIIVSLSSSSSSNTRQQQQQQEQQQIGGKKCILSLFRESASQDEQEKEPSKNQDQTKQAAKSEFESESQCEAKKRSKIKKGTKIYDNPAFHVNNNNNDYLQNTYLKTKGNIKEQGNKLFVNKKHLKNEEEEKEKELNNKMKKEGERLNKGPQQQQQQQQHQHQQRENSSSNKSGGSNSCYRGISSEEMLKNLSGGQKCVKMAATTTASSNEQQQQQQALAAAATAGQRTSVTHSNYNHLHESGAANAKEHSHSRRQQQQQQQQRGSGVGGDNKANLVPFDDSHHNSVSSSSVSSESSSALVVASSSSSSTSSSSSSSSSSTPTTASVSQSISLSDKQPQPQLQEQPLDGVVNENKAAHSSSIDYVTFPLLPHDSGINSSNSNNINNFTNNSNSNGVLHKQDNLLAHLPAYYNHNNYSSPSNLIPKNNNSNSNSNYLETKSGQLFEDHLTSTRNKTSLVESIETNINLGETSERRRRRSQPIRRHKELAKNGDVCEQVPISERQNFNYFELQGQQQQQQQQFNRNSTRPPVMQQHQQLSGDYYQSTPSQQQLNSLTGSQQTTCDESPLASSSNTDESNRNIYLNNQLATSSTSQGHFMQQQQQQLYNNQDSDTYHYYQVVVPETTNTTAINASSTYKRHVVDDQGMRFSGNNTINNDTSSSPTSRHINRIVKSLFNSNSNSQQQNNSSSEQLAEQLPSINQNLVISEPLIRSSSWQNKTLIDLNRQHRVPPLPPPPPPLPANQMQHHHHLDQQSASTISYNHAQMQYNNQNHHHHHATLNRFHHHHQQQQQYPLSHTTLEPAAIRTANSNNIELAHIEPPQTINHTNIKQDQEQAHFYCGVNTLRNSNNNNSLHQLTQHYAINYDHQHNPAILEQPNNQHNQSFQTLVNKMVTNNEHHQQQGNNKFPQMNSLLAYPGNNFVNSIENEISAKFCSGGGGSGRTAISGSSSSDNSTLNGIGRFDLTNRNKQKSRRGEFCCNLLKSTKLCFLLFLLSASACFILVALLSNYNPTTSASLDNDNDQLTSTATTMTTLIPTGLLDKDLSQLMAIHTQRKIPFINPNEIKQLNQQQLQEEQQQQMMNNNNNPLDYYGNSSNYRPVAPPGAIQNGQSSVIITSPTQVRPSSHATNQMINNRGVVGLNTQKAPPEAAAATTTTTTTTQAPVDDDLFQPSTQTYWVSNEQLLEELDEDSSNNNQCLVQSNNNNNAALECNLKGFCDKKSGCSCFPGFSGPTCAIANCPNDCSHRGECKLNLNNTITNLGTTNDDPTHLAFLSSLSFQTLLSSRWRNSICPKSIETEQESMNGWAKKVVKDISPNHHLHHHNHQQQQQQLPYSYDNRLEWQCVCQAGFTGPDCSQLRELQCNNEIDDDQDGLSDCEDDDCCSQPVCRDNHMCFKSPEPTKVLELMQQQQPQSSINNLFLNDKTYNRFYIQMRFLIANESVQSYAQEKMFDKNRVAVIRGKVVKSILNMQQQLDDDDPQSISQTNFDRGIVSARVSVEDNDQFGFTLTRNDGYFDMLVNGNEWITLQFHRNAYVPIKKKIFVKANTINSLEEDVEMWLSAKLTSSSVLSASASSLIPSTGALLSSQLTNINNNNNLAHSNNNAFINLQHPSEQKRLDCSFNLQLSAELYKLATNLRRNESVRRRNQLFECLLNKFVLPGQASLRLKYEPLIVLDDTTLSRVNNGDKQQAAISNINQEQLKSFVLSNSGAFQTQLDTAAGSPSSTSSSTRQPTEVDSSSPFKQIKFIYNSASFPPAASVVKPTLLIHLLPNNLEKNYSHDDENQKVTKLLAIIIQLDIEGQSRRERLKPLPSLSYQFAWNRRNIYNQKVYGFSELNIRIGYEYELKVNNNKSVNSLWNDCLLGNSDNVAAEIQQSNQPTTVDSKFKLPNILSNTYIDKKTVWFEQKVYIEAHQLNQHSDLGKWNLESSNRLDIDHQLIYFGSGWSLPYKLVYPPTVSEPISLINPSGGELSSSGGHIQSRQRLADEQQQQENSYTQPSPDQMVGRLMTRGPNSSMFIVILASLNSRTANDRLILLDSSRRRHLLDLPLSIIIGKLGVTSSSSSSTNQFQSNPDEPSNADTKNRNIDDIQLLYNNYLSTLYVSSKMAGKIVQVSYSSLLVLNKTLSSGSSTSAPEDEVDIENLAGFDRQTLTSHTGAPGDAIKAAKSSRLFGPHSMSLDEERQILYLIDGPTNLMAIDLNTNQVMLLPIVDTSYNKGGNTASSNRQQPNNNNNNCHRDSMKLPFRDYKAQQMHSLVWSKQDSSLYFVDQNVVFALRQDLTLEVIVASSTHIKERSNPIHSCFSKSELGSIKTLLIDEANNDLLIVHQWIDNNNKQQTPSSSSSKLSGRFYLAKVKVGIRTSINSGRNSVRRLIDLHSSTSAWDPMILKMASQSQIIKHHYQSSSSSSTNNNSSEQHNGQSINWTELATVKRHYRSHQQSILLAAGGGVGVGSKTTTNGKVSSGNNNNRRPTIPFIHLSRGFKRIDSIETNSFDGSIFVLDSSSNSIRLIEPYLPLSQDLNQFERNDIDINRLFEPPQGFEVDNIENQNESGERKLKVVNMINPISGEIMEFHASSGLQLSLTKPSGFKSEFYYKILNINSNSNNNNNLLDLDEDDKYDFSIQRLIANYNNNQLVNSNGAHIRLDQIIDSNGNKYEFMRSSTGSRFVLKSIIFNQQQTMCEIATDYLGVLNTYQASNKDNWLEIVYDSLTYLLRDMVIKEENNGSFSSNKRQTSHHNSNSNNNASIIRGHNLGWVKTKRIIYDKIFYHFCDLFEASA